MDSLTKSSTDWIALNEAALRALTRRAGPRVEAASVDGRKVWVKRFGGKKLPLLQHLHVRLSSLLPAHLHASRVLDAEGAAEREMRKAALFRTAGFPTPEVLWHERGTLAFADAGPTLQKRLVKLRESDADAHAALIGEAAGALGRLHAAGLCHGRPHPRDMCLSEDGRIGFFDFEEEPEAVMPLPDAQARDLWMFFVSISTLEARVGTLEAALAVYRAAAPAAVLLQMKPLLRLVRPLAAFGSFLPASLVRHDLRRIMAASNFLRTAI